ncbi:MAG: hypothetical protein J5663_08795 [Bacteroidaceae bacterium]|nr:hypothetical protein [Bacteroidaceae bacterium]
MKYSYDYIQQLILRFDEGQTTEAEEDVMKEYFTHSESVPDEWLPYKELFCGFDSGAFDFTQEEIDAMFTPAPAPRRKLWGWVAAACAVGVIALFFTPPRVSDEQTTGDNVLVAKVEPAQEPSTASEPVTTTPEPTTERVVTEKPKQHKASSHIQEPQPIIEEAEPDEEPVEMSEETRIELLLASLMEETPKMEEIDIEEEIRQIRIRGERMASMYANNKY